MGDLKTSIILDLSGNLQSRSRQFSGSLQTLGRQGSASMQLLGRGMGAVSRGLDRLGNRYTALFTGAAGLGAVKMVGDLEERFIRLGIQANKGAEEIDALKKQIYDAAKAPEIRIDPGQITAAIEEIVEKTGDLDFAKNNIRNIGLALQATGADGAAIGGILAEFQKMGMGAKEAFEALDILTVQGKEGAFTLENLAALGPRVVTAYTSMGRTGVGALREMGAALQVIRQGTGSSEQAATAFEALLSTLGDADKVKLLQKGGIQIFEPGSTTVMRSLPEIMEEIVKKSGGSKMALSKIFDAEAMRAFNSAISEFQRTGKVESLQRFLDVQADGTTLTKDSIRAAKGFNSALTNLLTVWKQFADKQLTEPIKKLTEYLDGLKPGTVENWLQMGKNIALVGGGLVVANKLGVFKLGSRLLRGKGGGLAGAAGAMGAGGAIPVYVVNGPSSIWSGAGKVGAGTAAGSAGGGLAAAGGLAMLPAVGAGAVAALSIQAGKALAESEVRSASPEALREMLDRHTVMGGGAGSYQAQLIKAEMNSRFGGELKITIDDEGRSKVTGIKTSSGFDIDVDSGRMMASH
jgi:hypothetical protein